MSGVEVRPATAADTAELAAIYLASRREYVAFAPLAHPDESVAAWIAGPLLVSGGLHTVLDQRRIVGLLAWSDDGEARWIDQLYLAPGATGRGTGGAALRYALARLAPPVRLHTFRDNVDARRFYERHGFRPVAFGDGSTNEEGVPDVLYERRAPEVAHRSGTEA